EVMAEALAAVEIKSPAVPLVANVVAEAVTDPEQIRKLLVEQVTGSVRWSESVAWMAAQGVTNVYELGAGKVLTGLARRIDKSLTGTAIGTPDDVEAVLAELI
ncbi:MAG: ACP S-malonyltransferase, partial [Alphaproteobacteria bacterium]